MSFASNSSKRRKISAFCRCCWIAASSSAQSFSAKPLIPRCFVLTVRRLARMNCGLSPQPNPSSSLSIRDANVSMRFTPSSSDELHKRSHRRDPEQPTDRPMPLWRASPNTLHLGSRRIRATRAGRMEESVRGHRVREHEPEERHNHSPGIHPWDFEEPAPPLPPFSVRSPPVGRGSHREGNVHVGNQTMNPGMNAESWAMHCPTPLAR